MTIDRAAQARLSYLDTPGAAFRPPGGPALRWAGNLKWLALTSGQVVSTCNRWPTVFFDFLSPARREARSLMLRSGLKLTIPTTYHFQSIAETVLMNLYRLPEIVDGSVLDIGASIGDFTLYAASRTRGKVLAFEPDVQSFAFLTRNIEINHATNVVAVNSPFSKTRGDAVPAPSFRGPIRFAKIDCEGCEYELFSRDSYVNWSQVQEVHMEIHPPPPGYSVSGLLAQLAYWGFRLETSTFGGCPYLHAYHESSYLNGSAIPHLSSA